MTKRLFVGGLSWDTNDEQLKAAFSTFGTVADAKVILDRDTGRSRGFGFVSYEDAAAGQKAIQEMDGKELDGRALRVNEAQEKSRSPRPDGGGGGGGGGGGRSDGRPAYRSDARPSAGGFRSPDKRKGRDDTGGGDRFSRKRSSQGRRGKPGFEESGTGESDVDSEY